jgi:hypothetical protein
MPHRRPSPGRLKSGLVSRGVEYPRTHNLGVLIELLGKAGVASPPELADIDRLTPFGMVFRYDEVLSQACQDRTQWLGCCRISVNRMPGHPQG